jgi:UDPglucose 6-dehydrogenase
VLGAAKGIGEILSDPLVIVNKSTVPVGTAARVEETIQAELDKRNIAVDFSVVSNPEFLKEGAAIEDFLKPDRIVIGTANEGPRARMRELYAPFNRSHNRLLFMDVASAELTKYAANAMLATKISFMNELANIAERVGADIEAVRVGIGSDPRIGYDFIYPGCGYGGSCFPKDVKALAQTAALAGYQTRILKAVDEVNKSQKLSLIDKIVSRYGDDLSGKKFSIWGLAFKPNTDDLREAASLAVIEGLNRRGAAVSAYDPVAIPQAQKIFSGNKQISFSAGLYDGLDNSDGLIVVTEWKQFRNPDYDQIRTMLREPVIFDGRNVFDPGIVCQHGLDYYSVGRAPLIIPSVS